MPAGLVTGKGQVERVAFPDPVPEAARLVVQISRCDICGKPGTTVGALAANPQQMNLLVNPQGCRRPQASPRRSSCKRRLRAFSERSA